MGGAYTAQPAATLDPPDVPPGWGGPDIPGSGGPGGTSPPGTLGGTGYWPFPPATGGGPFPPGYSPDYSFNTTVPSETAFDAAIDVSTQLRDQTDYTTGNPGGGSFITWSATVNGELRRIRFDGVGSYASSVDSSYASAAGYWGAAPTLDVELTANDRGEDLILALISTVGGFSAADSQTVSIGTGVITIKVELLSWTPYGSNYRYTSMVILKYVDGSWTTGGMNMAIYDDGAGLSQLLTEIPGEIEDSGISSTEANMLVTGVSGMSYAFLIRMFAAPEMAATFKATLVYQGSTYIKIFDAWTNWIIVNGDGVLTVVDIPWPGAWPDP